jgi:hypothetical protein
MSMSTSKAIGYAIGLFLSTVFFIIGVIGIVGTIYTIWREARTERLLPSNSHKNYLEWCSELGGTTTFDSYKRPMGCNVPSKK